MNSLFRVKLNRIFIFFFQGFEIESHHHFTSSGALCTLPIQRVPQQSTPDLVPLLNPMLTEKLTHNSSSLFYLSGGIPRAQQATLYHVLYLQCYQCKQDIELRGLSFPF